MHISDHRDFDARLKVKDFGNISKLTGAFFSIEISLQESKLVSISKDEFEYGDKSLWTAIFGNLRLSKSWNWEQNELLFKKKTRTSFLDSDWDLDGRNQASKREKNFDSPDQSNEKHILESSDYQKSKQGLKKIFLHRILLH